MRRRILWTLLIAAVTSSTQTPRDFLTADEVDQVRLTAQDPNARLALYATLARLRLDMIKQSVAKEKPGRSGFIHQTLEDYTKIIEAIDTVADDALKRGATLTEGMSSVVEAERRMVVELKAIDESEPNDIERYKFALTTAIETTQDSLELSEQDLAERKKDVAHKEAQDRKKVQEMMTPTEAKERAKAEQKQAATETKQQRKAPTLRKKGELPKPQ
jgi:hypothetical protein